MADIAAYRCFMAERLATLPNVAQTHSHVVIDEIKAQRALPIAD